MKAYMELKDILCRTKFGTKVRLLDLANDKVIATFEMGKFDYAKKLPREVLDAEPTDLSVGDNCLILIICKDTE